MLKIVEDDGFTPLKFHIFKSREQFFKYADLNRLQQDDFVLYGNVTVHYDLDPKFPQAHLTPDWNGRHVIWSEFHSPDVWIDHTND